MPETTTAPVFLELLAIAEVLRPFGGTVQAEAIAETCRRLQLALAEWWNAPLATAEASTWGGYSESQLRRLVHEGTIPVAPGGGIRRRDVPVRPGHPLPLPSIEPAPVAAADWAQDLLTRRQQRSVS